MRGRAQSGHGRRRQLAHICAGLLALLFQSAQSDMAHGDEAMPLSMSPWLGLPVVQIVPHYRPYDDFCRRHPAQCDLSGAGVVPYGSALVETLNSVNAAVNREVRFVLDKTEYDREEYWTLPDNGRGDCEDKALEKRRRLAERGLPLGAMRMALVFHRDWLSSHGVLTIETSKGTYVLDSRTDEVQRWDQVPYNFEARERPDGGWERFDQSRWRYD